MSLRRISSNSWWWRRKRSCTSWSRTWRLGRTCSRGSLFGAPGPWLRRFLFWEGAGGRGRIGAGEGVAVAEGEGVCGACGADFFEPGEEVAADGPGGADFGGFVVVCTGAGEDEGAPAIFQLVEAGDGVGLEGAVG